MAKGYDIALFMIMLVLSINIVTASGILGSGINVNYGDQIGGINSTFVGSINGIQQKESLSYPELAISAFGLLIRSLILIIAVLLYSTILLPIFLNQLMLPSSINLLITVGTWISYLVTYNQYRARSTLQGME